MKLRKLIYIFVLVCLLSACHSQKEPVIEYQESKEPFIIQLFYSKTCPHCKQLKEKLLPAIEADFGSQVTIEQYDIDEEESEPLYDRYIGIYDETTNTWVQEGLLEGIDEDTGSQHYTPLMIIGDYYAFMGYKASLNDAYLQDIHLALQNRPLASGDVAAGRWLFKHE